ncbi:MAG: dihydrodipicolinate synthase family protein [Haloarculaceae archaeon]
MQGTGVAVVTPFTEEGTIAEALLRKLVRWVEKRGVDFLVPCGSSGEAPLLCARDRLRVVEIVANEATIPVLAGTGYSRLSNVESQIDAMAELDIDGALVLTPYFYNPDQSSIVSYFREVADASPLPIYLYNVPIYTGIDLDPEVVQTLSEHERIEGIKDSNGNPSKIQRERELVNDDFDLFVGGGDVYALGLTAGADGGISGLTNVVPEVMTAIFELVRDGNEREAVLLNRSLLDLNDEVLGRFGIAGVKTALETRGIETGWPLRPHDRIDEESKAEIRSLVTRAVSDVRNQPR